MPARCRRPAVGARYHDPNGYHSMKLVERAALVRSLVSFSLLQALPRSLPAQAEETVGPASNFNRLQTGKPRPETGCILVEEVQSTGNAKSPTISAELVTNGGVAATVAFDSPWPLARGMYYDVEGRSSEGDSAYVHVRTLPTDKDVTSAPARYLAGAEARDICAAALAPMLRASPPRSRQSTA